MQQLDAYFPWRAIANLESHKLSSYHSTVLAMVSKPPYQMQMQSSCTALPRSGHVVTAGSNMHCDLH